MAILNVDDNAAARFLRSRILERAGYDVREAESAEQALVYGLADVPPHLILLDVALSDGDGFSVCERVKATHQHLPVVLITSIYHTSDARRDAFRAGADEYLLDPVEPSRLVEAVGQFLDPSHSVPFVQAATVITDSYGSIVWANAAAGRLLNISPRGLRGRTILGFCAPGRERVATHMRRAVGGQIVQETVRMRPRDRKPLSLRVDISAAEFECGGTLEWSFEPVLPVRHDLGLRTLSHKHGRVSSFVP